MRSFLTILGVVSSIFALLAFFVALTKGTDIQFIAAGVFGTMSAVSFGLGTVIERLDALKPTGG